jgi:hydroxylamine dehydrogenase
MNLGAKHWVVGEAYSAAPTCATCHMSATKNQKASHNPGKRISWTLRPVVSKRQENWEEKKRAMVDVCGNCHAPDWIAGHYTQYDDAVALYNEKFAKPAKKIMDALKQAKLVSATPFDDKLEWTYFYLWHHEGRRARMGASMMAPDYTQWHGFFEVAERFYMEFIPEAKEAAHGYPEVETVIASVLDMEEHGWKKEMSAAEMERVKAFYKRRYGQEAGGEKGHGAEVNAPPEPAAQPAEPAAESPESAGDVVPAAPKTEAAPKETH